MLNSVALTVSLENWPPISLCRKRFGVKGTSSFGSADWYANGRELRRRPAPRQKLLSSSSGMLHQNEGHLGVEVPPIVAFLLTVDCRILVSQLIGSTNKIGSTVTIYLFWNPSLTGNLSERIRDRSYQCLVPRKLTSERRELLSK